MDVVAQLLSHEWNKMPSAPLFGYCRRATNVTWVIYKCKSSSFMTEFYSGDRTSLFICKVLLIYVPFFHRKNIMLIMLTTFYLPVIKTGCFNVAGIQNVSNKWATTTTCIRSVSTFFWVLSRCCAPFAYPGRDKGHIKPAVTCVVILMAVRIATETCSMLKQKKNRDTLVLKGRAACPQIMLRGRWTLKKTHLKTLFFAILHLLLASTRILSESQYFH